MKNLILSVNRNEENEENNNPFTSLLIAVFAILAMTLFAFSVSAQDDLIAGVSSMEGNDSYTNETSNPIKVFEARSIGCRNYLTWIADTDVAYFAIQRSKDGKEFETVGVISDMDHSLEEVINEYIDEEPIRLAFYRLKQVPHEGEPHYSDIIPLRTNCQEDLEMDSDGSIYANPAQENVNIRFFSRTANQGEISISDKEGKILKQENFDHEGGGMRVFKMSTEALPPGNYQIHILCKDWPAKLFNLIIVEQQTMKDAGYKGTGDYYLPSDFS